MAKKKTKNKKGINLITLIGAVVVLLVLIYFCVRPVSVGFTYSKTSTDKLGLTTTTVETKFNSFTRKTTVTKVNDLKPIEVESFYFENDGEAVDLITTEKNYNEAKELAIKAKLPGKKINAFTYGEGEDTAVCGGAIAFVAVLAVVEIALAGITIMSILKKK